MDDSDRKSNNEQDIPDNVVSFITSDNTEASVPSTSNIIVSNEQLQSKDKPNWLLDYYDDLKSTENMSLQREESKWRRKINSCYPNLQGSNLT